MGSISTSIFLIWMFSMIFLPNDAYLRSGWNRRSDWNAVAKTVTTCPSSEHNIALANQLRVATWNVQKFGVKKVNTPELVEYIVKVIQRYDILVMEEVIDGTETAAPLLLLKLNEAVVANGGLESTYKMHISDRIGRNSYKEQYAYFYKKDLVSVIDSFQYPDTNDVFQVEPFLVTFKSDTTRTKIFTMIPIHTSPDDAEIEIDALTDVYNYLTEKTGEKNANAIILGDFNAGCTYVRGKDWAKIRLFTQKRFTWLISEHIDTTTKSTSCAYDRLVVAGGSFTKNIYSKSAKVFYFDHEYGITNETLIEKISDHYPVEFQIRGSVTQDLNREYDAFIGVSVESETTAEAIQEMKTLCESGSCGTNSEVLISNNDAMMVVFETKDPKNLLSELSAATKFPCVVTRGAATILSYKLNHNALIDASLYGSDKDDDDVLRLTVLCYQTTCKISVDKPTKAT